MNVYNKKIIGFILVCISLSMPVLVQAGNNIIAKVCNLEQTLESLPSFTIDVTSCIDVVCANVQELICDPQFIDMSPYTITASGNYIVTQDLSVTGQTAIIIDADQVSLNLCHHTITGFYNATGIEILDGHTDITIYDGFIIGDYDRGIETGILLSDSTERVAITNLFFSHISASAIHAISSSYATIQDVQIENVYHALNYEGYCEYIGARNVQVRESDYPIMCLGNDDYPMHNIVFDTCKILDSTITADYCIRMEYVEGCFFESSLIDKVTSDGDLYVIYLANASNCVFDTIAITRCLSATQLIGVYGGVFPNMGPREMVLRNVHMSNNISENVFYAIRLQRESQNVYCYNVLLDNNIARGDFYGFALTDTVYNIIFDSCYALYNRSSGSSSYGFLLEYGQNCLVKNCLSNGNVANNGLGVGFLVGSDFTYSELFECVACSNSQDGFFVADTLPKRSSAQQLLLHTNYAYFNQQYGFNLSGAYEHSIFLKNSACGNGVKDYFLDISTNITLDSFENAQGFENRDCFILDMPQDGLLFEKSCSIASKLDLLQSKIDVIQGSVIVN